MFDRFPDVRVVSVENGKLAVWLADDKKNLGTLAKYAKEMGLFNKVNDLIGVMING